MLPARRLPVVVASVALLVTALTGCARNHQAGSQPSAPASSPPTSAPASPSPTTPAPATPAPAGVVWPIGVRTLAAPSTPPTEPAVLKAISTGRHDAYERLVLTFTGGYTTVTVKYVPVVRADASD